ncbi:hypothetical protein HanRHA438_Chr11g0490161 [Helianthus annuus]|nr:hypothetical protein HanIR_Chr11g0513901 [Helianthus annuus]KAJ0869532.1 hypothetical protein HanRHA438_Chr11g0490161 [Helianthus annuus]
MDRSAWGRGGEDLLGEKCFWKTNKLQTSNVCARLRDADISGQKHFWPKNKHHLSVEPV